MFNTEINRELMGEQEERAFVQKCFSDYEADGFLDTFNSPYSEGTVYNGKPYTVIRRLTEDEADLCCLPMWEIEFADGTQISAFPEEITKLEKNVEAKLA